jgi:hypothetical protein
MRCTCDLFSKALHKARSTYSRFADDQRYLTFTFERALPAIRQEAQFGQETFLAQFAASRETGNDAVIDSSPTSRSWSVGL